MKAWIVTDRNYFYSEVVFAETSGKAKALALETDAFEDCEFCDIRVNRLPKADKAYRGREIMDWYNDKDRIFLVKECGWHCGEEFFDFEECGFCCANEYCSLYKEKLIEVNE